MHTIKKRILIIETTTCIWFLFLHFLFPIPKLYLNYFYIIIFWIVVGAVTILLVFLLIKTCRIYENAKLIVENSIICISSALIKEGRSENIETYISCFGILIDSRVIKYNVGNIILKGVEIDSEYICINYGKGEKNQQSCILHGKISKEEQQQISKRFHYETGITPILKQY